MEVLLEENPWENPWFGQPIRHARASRKGWQGRRTMRNPTGVAALTQDWLQGMDMKDIGAAGLGLVASSVIPSQVIKETADNQQKLLRLAVSAGVAVAAGMAGNALLGRSAGRAALAGGIAGTVVQFLQNFTDLPVGGSGSGVRRVISAPAGRAALGSGVRRYPSNAYEESFQNVRLQ